MKPKWKDVSSTQPAVSCFTLYVTFALKISTTIVDKRELV